MQNHAVATLRRNTQIMGVTHRLRLAVYPHMAPAHVVDRTDRAVSLAGFGHPHIRFFAGHPGATKIVRVTLEIEGDRPRLRRALQQRQDGAIVLFPGLADAVAHSTTSRADTCGRRSHVGSSPGQYCRDSILMLPSIMPRSRHCCR